MGLREWTIVLDADGLAALRGRLAAAGLGDGDVVGGPVGDPRAPQRGCGTILM